MYKIILIMLSILLLTMSCSTSSETDKEKKVKDHPSAIEIQTPSAIESSQMIKCDYHKKIKQWESLCKTDTEICWTDNSIYFEKENRCECLPWFSYINNSCQNLRNLCQDRGIWNQSLNNCNCDNWFINYKEGCWTDKEICKTNNSLYNPKLKRCECSYYTKLYNWNCLTDIEICKTENSFYDSFEWTCKCIDNFESLNGKCVKKEEIPKKQFKVYSLNLKKDILINNKDSVCTDILTTDSTGDEESLQYLLTFLKYWKEKNYNKANLMIRGSFELPFEPRDCLKRDKDWYCEMELFNLFKFKGAYIENFKDEFDSKQKIDKETLEFKEKYGLENHTYEVSFCFHNELNRRTELFQGIFYLQKDWYGLEWKIPIKSVNFFYNNN